MDIDKIKRSMEDEVIAKIDNTIDPGTAKAIQFMDEVIERGTFYNNTDAAKIGFTLKNHFVELNKGVLQFWFPVENGYRILMPVNEEVGRVSKLFFTRILREQADDED